MLSAQQWVEYIDMICAAQEGNTMNVALNVLLAEDISEIAKELDSKQLLRLSQHVFTQGKSYHLREKFLRWLCRLPDSSYPKADVFDSVIDLAIRDKELSVIYLLLKYSAVNEKNIEKLKDYKQDLFNFICNLDEGEQYWALCQIVYKKENSQLSDVFHLKRGHFFKVRPHRGCLGQVVRHHAQFNSLDALMESLIAAIKEVKDAELILKMIDTIKRQSPEMKARVLSYRSQKYDCNIYQVLDNEVDIRILKALVILSHDVPLSEQTRSIIFEALKTAMLVDRYNFSIAHDIAAGSNKNTAQQYLTFIDSCIDDVVLKPKVMKLLAAKTRQGWTVVHMFIRYQDAELVEQFLSFIEKCLSDTALSSQALELLQCQNNHGWHLGHFITRYQPEQISTFMTLIQVRLMSGEISFTAVLDWLQCCTNRGETLGHFIASYGNSSDLMAYLELLQWLNQQTLSSGGCLDDIRKLCIIKNGKGSDFFDILTKKNQGNVLLALQQGGFILPSKMRSDNFKAAKVLINDALDTQTTQQQMILAHYNTSSLGYQSTSLVMPADKTAPLLMAQNTLPSAPSFDELVSEENVQKVKTERSMRPTLYPDISVMMSESGINKELLSALAPAETNDSSSTTTDDIDRVIAPVVDSANECVECTSYGEMTSAMAAPRQGDDVSSCVAESCSSVMENTVEPLVNLDDVVATQCPNASKLIENISIRPLDGAESLRQTASVTLEMFPEVPKVVAVGIKTETAQFYRQSTDVPRLARAIQEYS